MCTTYVKIRNPESINNHLKNVENLVSLHHQMSELLANAFKNDHFDLIKRNEHFEPGCLRPVEMC